MCYKHISFFKRLLVIQSTIHLIRLEMNQLIKYLIIFLLLTPLWSFLFWYFQEKKPIRVLIFDKTVLTKKTQEHISFSWILNNEQYTNPLNGNSYNRKADYKGFFPDEKGGYHIDDYNQLTKENAAAIADQFDMAYYSDMYGIYRGEWDDEYFPQKNITDDYRDYSMERTRKIYGGMTSIELEILKKMKAQNKLIITEFNTIASPTSWRVRRDFEKEFDIFWSGWVGRYYETLDTTINKELPRWLKHNYLAQHNNQWPFHKSGIVFVRVDDRIEILENETDLLKEVPIIITPDIYQAYYNLPKEMKYSFWFDIVSRGKLNDVVATYQLYPNIRGRKLLKTWGIPEQFPAVIEHNGPDYRFHYFAADFCDNPIGYYTSYFKGIQHISQYTYSRDAQERESFFWNYYRPMLTRIMNDYYKEKIVNKQ